MCQEAEVVRQLLQEHGEEAVAPQQALREQQEWGGLGWVEVVPQQEGEWAGVGVGGAPQQVLW